MVSKQSIDNANVSRRTILTSIPTISIVGTAGCLGNIMQQGEVFVLGNNSSNTVRIEMIGEDETTIHNETYETESYGGLLEGSFSGDPQMVNVTVNDQQTKETPYEADCSDGFVYVELHNDSTMTTKTTCEDPLTYDNQDTSQNESG